MQEKAKVYFTDFRALPGTNLQKKLEKLMKKYKYFGIDYRDEIVKVSDEELLNNPDYRIVFEL